MKIYFYTFGCKVNQYETDHVIDRVLERGHQVCEDPIEADACVINTCTVTEQADKKLMQLIRRIKRQAPETVIVLAGCFPQAFRDKAEALAECDIIVGTRDKGRIPELLEQFMLDGKRIVSVSLHKAGDAIEEMACSGRSGKTRAYIKIQDGCDQYCTYCVIPFARGHIRSKPIEDIIREARGLLDTGHKELILTGINLWFYGRDLDDRPGLVDAVEAICGLGGDFRVRLGSIEPEVISDEDITRLRRLDKLCPHFHLSLQSGCTETLRRMNRRYTAEEFMDLCRKLRVSFPGCALTTDIMVGFPGETREEFETSLNNVKTIGFSEAHIFPYSRRPGTKADQMDGQVDKYTKHQRAAAMAEVCAKSRDEYLNGWIGKEVRVLFERETEPQWHCGHSDNYMVVKVPRPDPSASLRRQFRTVRITRTENGCCYGELV